ncbi:MAG: DNA polymerase III subunit delta [Planctomycetota bacterium]|jgi:DNA polymerase III delta subunit
MARGNDLSATFKALASGKTVPVYAVVGSDPGLREELIARIRRAVLGEDGSGGAQVTLGPADPARPSSAPTLAAVVDEVGTASLFAPVKLVLVREADALVADKAAQDRLRKMVAEPVPGTVLVLDLEKLDKRKGLAKALAKGGGLLECPRLYSSRFGESDASMASSMGVLLRQMAQERGVKLSDDAGRRLLELADGEVGFLRAELDKLADFLGKKKREARAEDVEALACRGASEVTPIVRQALAGRGSRALAALGGVFERGMDLFGRVVWDEAAIALGVVNAAGRELRTVERTVLNGGRCPPARSGKSLPPQVAAPIEAAARRLKGEGLERAYRLVLEADQTLKSSSGRSPQGVVEELLVRLSGIPVSPQPAGRFSI